MRKLSHGPDPHITYLRISVIPKPYTEWTKAHQNAVFPLMVLFAVCFSLDVYVTHLSIRTYDLQQISRVTHLEGASPLGARDTPVSYVLDRALFLDVSHECNYSITKLVQEYLLSGLVVWQCDRPYRRPNCLGGLSG